MIQHMPLQESAIHVAASVSFSCSEVPQVRQTASSMFKICTEKLCLETFTDRGLYKALYTMSNERLRVLLRTPRFFFRGQWLSRSWGELLRYRRLSNYIILYAIALHFNHPAIHT